MRARARTARSSAELRGFWNEVRRRPGRLRPSHLPTALRILAVVSWIGAGLILLLGFGSGLFMDRKFDLFNGEVSASFQPLWPLMCGIAVGSGVAATGFVYMATRQDAPRHHAALAWCAGVGVPLIPLLLLALDRSWQAIPVACALVASAAMVVTYVHIRRCASEPWLGFLLTCLVAATWIPAIYANVRAALALSGVVPVGPNDLLDLLGTNLMSSAFVGAGALFFVAVMTAAGVALAAHSRSNATDQLHRREPNWRLTAVLCAISIAIIVLEVWGVGGISSGFYKGYWGLRSLGTWPHAVLVAGLIAVVAQRSHLTPLQQRGDVSTTVIVGVSALASDLVLAAAFTVFLVKGAITGSLSISQPPGYLQWIITWLALVALVPIAVRPAMRGTVGQWVARVALLYLVPVFIPITLMELGFDVPFTFWATPVQVAIVLTAIGCVATVLGLLGRPTFIAPDVASRLVIIPLLIVAGTSWLPTFITGPLTPVIAVAAALFTLLWAMPPVAADEERHSGVVLTASAQLLLVVAAAAVVSGHPDLKPDDPTFALLHLGVPLSALLCARVTSTVRVGTDKVDTF